jgi:hypothetical protein
VFWLEWRHMMTLHHQHRAAACYVLAALFVVKHCTRPAYHCTSSTTASWHCAVPSSPERGLGIAAKIGHCCLAPLQGYLLPFYHQHYWVGLRASMPFAFRWTDPYAPTPSSDTYQNWGTAGTRVPEPNNLLGCVQQTSRASSCKLCG